MDCPWPADLLRGSHRTDEIALIIRPLEVADARVLYPVLRDERLYTHIDEAANRASVAYVVLPPVWGRGIAKRATAWLLEQLRAEFGVVEAQVEIHEDNARSLALARRLGFVEVEVRQEGDHLEHVLRRRLDD